MLHIEFTQIMKMSYQTYLTGGKQKMFKNIFVHTVKVIGVQ